MLLVSYPGALGVALVTAALAISLVRRARASGAAAAAGAERRPGESSTAPGWRGVARRVRPFWPTVAAGGAAAVLLWLDTPPTDLLLGLLALGAGGWLARELYRREVLDRGRRRVLAGARLLAWTMLLALLARPTCQRQVVQWDKPVLAVLLDHSSSMALRDGPSGPTRAALASTALGEARDLLERLEVLYEVRRVRIGARPEPAGDWSIEPRQPLTGLAAALRDAAAFRSAQGQLPAAVVVISDGAETVRDAGAVRQAAAELAEHRTPLLAVGVGPPPDQTPLIELEPLSPPPRVGPRDVLRVGVAGRAQGCPGRALEVELLWGDTRAARTEVSIGAAQQRFATTLETVPPGPGVHRLTARVSLPAAVSRSAYLTSALVDVAAEHVRVLYVERVPRTEAAFVTRAWRGDEGLDVTTRFLFAAGPGAPALGDDLWNGYDVVVLGQTGPRLSAPLLEALARAVNERGVGLLLCGGRELLNDTATVDSPLADLSPVYLHARRFGQPGPLRLALTDAGRRHAVFTAPTPDASAAAWPDLPPLGGAALLGPPKPAAEVLATDPAGQPLLAAHEVGRGRCIAAGWESTWPWALASAEGGRLHEQLWRQMVVWLANRRPQAWVVTDEPQYAQSALATGERQVRIRAGVSGLPAPGEGDSREIRAQLMLRGPQAAEPPVPLVLQPAGDSWQAELPAGVTGPADTAPPAAVLAAAGAYRLELSVRGAGLRDRLAAADANDAELTARTQFDVVAEDVELRPPTANLGLLRAAAESTAAWGGRYAGVGELRDVLKQLTSRDPRQRLTRPVRYDPAARDPWGLLGWLTAALATEWLVRKRSGLT